MMNKTTTWNRDKINSELTITVTKKFEDNSAAHRAVVIPWDQAVEMIKELYAMIEFEEHYDIYCPLKETTGG